jgi:hypothetical protein
MSAKGLHPASASAIAKCALARTRPSRPGGKDIWTELAARIGVSNSHPRECGWCIYSVDELNQMLASFDLYGEDATWFRGQTAARQHAMVLEAQAFA